VVITFAFIRYSDERYIMNNTFDKTPLNLIIYDTKSEDLTLVILASKISIVQITCEEGIGV